MGSVIDTGTISRGIVAAFADGIPGQAGIPSAQELSQEAVRLMGVRSKGDSILNLPLALNTAFMTMLVPTVSGLLASGRKKAAGMIFIALNQTVTGSLQGLGQVSVPARALLCGVMVKVALHSLLHSNALVILTTIAGSAVLYFALLLAFNQS